LAGKMPVIFTCYCQLAGLHLNEHGPRHAVRIEVMAYHILWMAVSGSVRASGLSLPKKFCP
jgi:hypothetical protein